MLEGGWRTGNLAANAIISHHRGQVEQQPPETAAVSRSQNAVHVVPGDWAIAPAALALLLDRAAAESDAVQAVVLVADADAAVGVVEALVRARGGVPPRVVAATGAARIGRVLRAGAAPVVVGAPAQIVALAQASVLKLEQVRGVAVAWVEEILAAGGGADLEAIMAEVPKDVPRTILTAALSPAVEDFIERYARRAPRFGVPTTAPAPGTGSTSPSQDGPGHRPPALDAGPPPVSIPLGYVLVTPPARANVLRRLLDEIDPPSAAIYVRSDDSERAVRQALIVLGYHGDDAAVRVVRGPVADHTALLVLFDLPYDAEELTHATAGVPGRTVAFLLPRQLGHLNALTDGPVRPFVFAGPAEAARGREEAVRAELRREVAAGSLAREVLSLEPLLAEFDGIALAAAALRLLERHRQPGAAASAATPADRPATRPATDSRASATSERSFGAPSGGGHGPPPARGGGSGGSRGSFGGSGGARRSGARGEEGRGGRGSGPPGRGSQGAPRGGGRRPGGEGGGRGQAGGGDRRPTRPDTRPLPRSPR